MKRNTKWAAPRVASPPAPKVYKDSAEHLLHVLGYNCRVTPEERQQLKAKFAAEFPKMVSTSVKDPEAYFREMSRFNMDTILHDTEDFNLKSKKFVSRYL